MNDLGVIHFTNGGFCIVDAALFPELNAVGWSRSPNGYACRTLGLGSRNRKKKLYLHREVNHTQKGVLTDHRNRIKIDNTSRNLRSATKAQNNGNAIKKKWRGKCGSVYKGVYWSVERQKWIAQIKLNHKMVNLGGFSSEWDAALAYNIAAKNHFGGFARLNQL